VIRIDDAAQEARENRSGPVALQVSRQERHRARRDGRRPPYQAHRAPLRRVAGSRPVPVSRRGRHSTHRRLGRHQRLSAPSEQRAAKLARQAGAKGRKARDAAVADSIEGSLTTLLKKSRVVRKKAAVRANGKAAPSTAPATGQTGAAVVRRDTERDSKRDTKR